MKLRSVLVTLVAVVSFVVLLTVHQDAGAQTRSIDWRAGVAGFVVGQDGINIFFSTPMPDTNYAVVVQPTNTAGYSPTSDCTYFNPLHKRLDGFEVQHKRCADGVPVALDVNVSLAWIAASAR